VAEPCLLVPQEMAESIRHHTTIEPCDGASESGEDQDKDSHELVEDFEDSGKAAVGRRTRAQMSAGHVEMAGSGGTEMGACNEEEAWQRIEAEEVEEERSRREQLREMLQRGGGQEVGDEEGSGEVQEGDEEEEEMSWGAAGVEEEVMEGPRAPKIRVFSSQAHAPGECPQPTKYDLMQAARVPNTETPAPRPEARSPNPTTKAWTVMEAARVSGSLFWRLCLLAAYPLCTPPRLLLNIRYPDLGFGFRVRT
jgi:hypothetical protein